MVSKAGLQASARCDWCGDLEDSTAAITTRNGASQFAMTSGSSKSLLEGFQAGLSWLTILRKREAFSDFEIEHVAQFSERDVQRLLGNRGIVRYRGKIEAAIHNAKCAQEMLRTESSLAAYFWQYEPDPRSRPTRVTPEVYRAMTTSPESIRYIEGFTKARLEVCQANEHVCLDAGIGLGE